MGRADPLPVALDQMEAVDQGQASLPAVPTGLGQADEFPEAGIVAGSDEGHGGR
jgi:hypothetical protein